MVGPKREPPFPGDERMATERTAAEIGRRFEAEQEHIRRYVELLRSRLVVTSSDVWDIRGILESWNLVPPKTILGQERNPPELTAEEIGKEVASLAKVMPAINQAIAEQEELLQELFADLESPPLTAQESEWVEYLGENYGDALLTMDHEEILSRCVRQHEWQCADAEEPLNQDMVRQSIRYATGVRSVRKIRALEHARKSLTDTQVLLRLVSPDAEINILRQGFILLMTALDAAIFDLVRIKLRKDFFALIGAFGKSEKVSLQEISEAGSFESFRDQVIEKQLKIRYVKDLLGLLQGLGVKCVHEANGDTFGHLIELVLRRNVHIHNRGIVDERYLERDQQGTPKNNLYNLNLGDVATIDEAYWERAVRLCRCCVDWMAVWAGA
jgi:hypothetical protein